MVGIKINVTEEHVSYMRSNSKNYSKYIRALIDFDMTNSRKIRKFGDDVEDKLPPLPPLPPTIEEQYEEIEQPPIYAATTDDDNKYYSHKKIKHPPKPLTPDKKKEVEKLKDLVGKFNLMQALEESDEDNKK